MPRLTVKVQLPLLLWIEDDQYVAYTPALELSSCGADETEAVRNFAEAVELFFETADERRVLKDLLESLGWTYQSKTWKPHREALAGSRSFEVQVPLPQAA